MAEKSLLTVIVPVKNMASNLGLFGSWLTNIHDLPILVRVIVDESDDETLSEVLAIIKRAKNSQVSIIAGKYLSPGSSRNAGLRDISTKWVTFWDSDDYPFVENVINAIVETNEITNVIIGSYISTEFSNTPNWTEFQKASPSRKSIISILRNPGLWRWVFTADLINEINFPNYLMGEDQCFLAEVLLRNPVIEYSDKIFYSYSINRIGALTNNNNKYRELKSAIARISFLIDKSQNISIKLLLRITVFRLRLTLLKGFVK